MHIYVICHLALCCFFWLSLYRFAIHRTKRTGAGFYSEIFGCIQFQSCLLDNASFIINTRNQGSAHKNGALERAGIFDEKNCDV